MVGKGRLRWCGVADEKGVAAGTAGSWGDGKGKVVSDDELLILTTL